MKRALLLTLAAVVSVLVSGCSPDGPTEPKDRAGASEIPNAELAAEKERHAVDLGAPSGSPMSTAVGSAFASTLGSTVSSIPFDPEPGPFANDAGLFCDDCTIGGLPIGFSFTFFGNTYTTFSISSNGFVGFDPSMSHGCCSGRSIPLNDGINNLIAAAWTDLYPGGGGGIFYETRGRVPSQYLIVS